MANDRIHELLESFAKEIRAEVHRQAIEALSGGFVGGSKSNGKAAKAAPRAAASNRKGAKRDPAALDALRAKFLAFIVKNPGLRIEQINKQVGTSTKDLALPIKKLLAAKAIKATGQKRATTYSPASSGSVRRVKKATKGGKKRGKATSDNARKRAASDAATA